MYSNVLTFDTIRERFFLINAIFDTFLNHCKFFCQRQSKTLFFLSPHKVRLCQVPHFLIYLNDVSKKSAAVMLPPVDFLDTYFYRHLRMWLRLSRTRRYTQARGAMGFLTFRESKYYLKFEVILFINFKKKNYLHI